MPTQMSTMGTQVLFMPTAMPLMIVVAEPVSDWSAMRLTEP